MANKTAMKRERERMAAEQWERERAELRERPRSNPILMRMPWVVADAPSAEVSG